MVKTQRKLAFTLAEVLITLGIIGVVAALTIPNLMQKTNRKETVAAVKKSYSVLSNALKLAEAQHGGSILKWSGTVADEFSTEDYEQYGLSASDWIGYMYLLDNLKIVKSCGTQAGCFIGAKSSPNSTITLLNGDVDPTYPLGGCKKAILADGFSIALRQRQKVIGQYIPPPNSHLNKYLYYIQIYVDVNGNKAPNKLGYDQFVFTSNEKGILTGQNLENNTGNVGGSDTCNLESNGYDCTQYIMENDNMNYLDE